MQLIPDDPIISSIERTGFPPWLRDEPEEEEDDDDEYTQAILLGDEA